jgi:hypothetical protein
MLFPKDLLIFSVGKFTVSAQGGSGEIFQWNEGISIGTHLIDSDRRALIAIINGLHAARCHPSIASLIICRCD